LETLDLHTILHEDAPGIIENFIILNFLNLPIEIITGNSIDMQCILKEITIKHNLRMAPSHSKNLGSYIINKKL